jgi:hypothetical protein
MRDERAQARPLVSSERCALWSGLTLGAVVLIGLAAFLALREGRPRMLNAVVRVSAVESVPDTGQRYMWIESRLDGGKYVRATGLLQAEPPRPGAKIVLTERVSWLGRRFYEWYGQTQ